MRGIRAIFLAQLFSGLSGSLGAQIDCKNCGDQFRPSIPPPVMRMPMSAKVLPDGVGRSGIQLSFFDRTELGQAHQYPLDSEGRVSNIGLSTRWGFQGGVEIGGAIDYPFLVPSFLLRIQPFGSEWNYGPFLTAELGANAMPDYHAGISAGLGATKMFDAHASYQIGKMLDRDYGEWGGGVTARVSPILDIEFGGSMRTFWGVPISGDSARVSLSLVLGNKSSQIASSSEIKAFDGDPFKAAKAGDHQAAANLFKRELKFDPKNGELWHGFGESLKALGRDREAMRAFARARKLNFRISGEKPVKDEPESVPDDLLPRE